jgi:hypothetical protein
MLIGQPEAAGPAAVNQADRRLADQPGLILIIFKADAFRLFLGHFYRFFAILTNLRVI